MTVSFLILLLCVVYSRAIPESKELEASEKDDVCTEGFGRYPDEQYCDSFLECENFEAHLRQCPDGLVFKQGVPLNEYPCVLPSDSPCSGRSIQHPPQPTKHCPRQNGLFPYPNRTDCNSFIQCTGGVAFEKHCPPGLVFDSALARCNWPGEVEECAHEALFNMQCPDLQTEINAGILNLPIVGECRHFFACVEGKPRLLSCDPGFGFHPDSRRCVDEELVDNCHHTD